MYWVSITCQEIKGNSVVRQAGSDPDFMELWVFQKRWNLIRISVNNFTEV